jgi:hypothetical protein
MASVFLSDDGRARFDPGWALQQAINAPCQYDPLHQGEIVKISHPAVYGGMLSFKLTTTSRHTETRGIGAFSHEELRQGDTRIMVVPGLHELPRTLHERRQFWKTHKGAIKSAEDRDQVEAIVKPWLAFFDTEEAAEALKIGNTASGVFVHEVKLGMSFAEVEQALGVPVTRVDLGEKVLYKYKDTTVEFKNGAVVDVR